MKPNVLEGPLLCMVDGRFARVDINVTDLGSQDDEINKVAAKTPTNLANAFLLPGGRPAHIQTIGSSVIVWTELLKLNLSTVFTVARDGSRYPIFKHKPTTSPPEHEATMEWDPAVAGMRIFFTSTLEWTEPHKLYLWKASYLIAKHPKRKEIFVPPLPNLFTDARLCLGNEYRNNGACLADVFCHSLAHFETSRWNSDAMEGLTGDDARAMFSFDKGNKQIPPGKEYSWTEIKKCHTVNNLNYGDLPIV